MGVENTVDFIGIKNESSICTHTIVDSLEWNNEYEHLLLLQEKINSYLSFIEFGEIYITYLPSKDKVFELNIRFKNPITKNCEQFIQHASHIVSDAGFVLFYSIG